MEVRTTYATAASGIYSIEGNAYQNNGSGYSSPSAHYGQIFDWQITTAAPGQCGRKSVTVTYDCIAPVKLVEFKGVNKDGKNYLDWKTATESDNDYFNIERSYDGNNFSIVGTVEGAGDSKNPLSYTFIDQEPKIGVNYYRLVQYDKDGKINYSGSIVIENSPSEAYIISPNPFEGEVHIQTNIASESYIQVTTPEGSEVYSGNIHFDENNILSIGRDFKPGMYILKIQDGQGLYTYKVIKK